MALAVVGGTIGVGVVIGVAPFESKGGAIGVGVVGPGGEAIGSTTVSEPRLRLLGTLGHDPWTLHFNRHVSALCDTFGLQHVNVKEIDGSVFDLLKQNLHLDAQDLEPTGATAVDVSPGVLFCFFLAMRASR